MVVLTTGPSERQARSRLSERAGHPPTPHPRTSGGRSELARSVRLVNRTQLGQVRLRTWHVYSSEGLARACGLWRAPPVSAGEPEPSLLWNSLSSPQFGSFGSAK